MIINFKIISTDKYVGVNIKGEMFFYFITNISTCFFCFLKNLFESVNCTEDYIEIRDGYYHNSTVLDKFCGDKTNYTVVSKTSRLLITYVNRHASEGYRGFIADYEGKCKESRTEYIFTSLTFFFL